mgnify:CR=1 FL=1
MERLVLLRHKSFLYEINSFCRSILSVFLNGYLANVRFIVKILKSGLTLLKDSSKIVIKEKEKPVIQNAFVYEDLEERIKSIIGSKVHVNHKANGKGKIEIEYYSDNDLERIFELLMSIQEGK